MLYYRSKLIP